MQQENNIKMVKTVLKSLGAGKSNSAMVRTSAAAPVIDSIATNFQEGAGIKVPPSKFEHQKKSYGEDKEILLAEIQASKPFEMQRGRSLVPAWPTGMVDRSEYLEFAYRNAHRAISRSDVGVLS